MDLQQGINWQWFANLTNASQNAVTSINQFGTNSFNLGSNADLNGLGLSIISWNWSYPLAKAWHANGGTTRKVPTPWGIVDSVESNASSGITGDQVVIELYNPLTGNGCLLYVGNSANGTLDITGNGIAPKFTIVKALTTTIHDTRAYHSNLNGGTTPGRYSLELNTTSAEGAADDTIWNGVALPNGPTSSLLGLGVSAAVNETAKLHVAYYFSPIAGLQKFGGYAGNAGTQNVITGCKDGMYFGKLRAGGADNWTVLDSFRGADKPLYWNLTNVEGSQPAFSFGSTSGFDINSSLELNQSGDDYIYGHFGEQLIPQGNFDVYPTTPLTSTGSNDIVEIMFEYNGTAELNTELNLYASRQATPSWIQGTMTSIADLLNGHKLITANIDISANATDTRMRWRLETNESPYTEHNINTLRITWR